MPRASAFVLAVSVFSLTITTACHDSAPATGEMVIAVETDVALPDSVDRIRVEVTRFGSLVFGSDFEVGAGKLAIPATLGLVAGKNPGDAITVRLIARKVGKVKMLREITTTVPAARIANLRMPIRWLCDDSASEPSPGVVVEKTCPAGQTCIGGDCRSSEVDSAMAEAASASDFMGGNATCFDVFGCMSGGTPVTPDPVTCTFPKASGAERLNVALAVENDGICQGASCFVILDKAPLDGWQDLGSAVQLPHAVCARLSSGRVKQVVTSSSCASKTERDAVCGPWFPHAGATPTPPTTAAGDVATLPGSIVHAGAMFVSGDYIVFNAGPQGQGEELRALRFPGGQSLDLLTALGDGGTWGGPWGAKDAVYWVKLQTTPALQVLLYTAPTTGANLSTSLVGPIPNPTNYLPTGDLHAAIDAQSLFIPGSTGPSGSWPIYAYPRAGGTPVRISAGVPPAGLDPLAIVADGDPAGGYVYRAKVSLDGSAKAVIERFAKAAVDGPAVPIATLPTANMSQLTLDGSDLYFIGFDGRVPAASAIYKVAADGKSPAVTLYGGLQTAASLAVDGDNLYWAAHPTAGDTTAEILKAPKSGDATPTVIAAGLPLFPSVLTVADAVYYATSSPSDNAIHVATVPK